MTTKTEATASLDAHTIAAIVGQAVSAALAANRPGVVPPPLSAGVERVMTEAGSHVATGKGYAKGILLDVGDAIPPGVAVSDVWMRPATNDDHVAEAEAEAA